MPATLLLPPRRHRRPLGISLGRRHLLVLLLVDLFFIHPNEVPFRCCGHYMRLANDSLLECRRRCVHLACSHASLPPHQMGIPIDPVMACPLLPRFTTTRREEEEENEEKSIAVWAYPSPFNSLWYSTRGSVLPVPPPMAGRRVRPRCHSRCIINAMNHRWPYPLLLPPTSPPRRGRVASEGVEEAVQSRTWDGLSPGLGLLLCSTPPPLPRRLPHKTRRLPLSPVFQKERRMATWPAHHESMSLLFWKRGWRGINERRRGPPPAAPLEVRRPSLLHIHCY